MRTAKIIAATTNVATVISLDEFHHYSTHRFPRFSVAAEFCCNMYSLLFPLLFLFVFCRRRRFESIYRSIDPNPTTPFMRVCLFVVCVCVCCVFSIPVRIRTNDFSENSKSKHLCIIYLLMLIFILLYLPAHF